MRRNASASNSATAKARGTPNRRANWESHFMRPTRYALRHPFFTAAETRA